MRLTHVHFSNFQMLFVNDVDLKFTITFFDVNFMKYDIDFTFCNAFAIAHQNAFVFFVEKVSFFESLRNDCITLIFNVSLNCSDELFEKRVISFRKKLQHHNDRSDNNNECDSEMQKHKINKDKKLISRS